MKLIDIARLKVGKESRIFDTMPGCDIVSRFSEKKGYQKDNYREEKKKAIEISKRNNKAIGKVERRY